MVVAGMVVDVVFVLVFSGSNQAKVCVGLDGGKEANFAGRMARGG